MKSLTQGGRPQRGENATGFLSSISRRDFFTRASDGLCGAALAYLLARDFFVPNAVLASSTRDLHDLKPRSPQLESKAKAVIQLFMSGGPSQVDLFDPKPALAKYAGQLPR